jgi:uncharacterized protein (DUF427 family)
VRGVQRGRVDRWRRPYAFPGRSPRASTRSSPVRAGSVWDYPRPPRVEPVPERIRVVVGGVDVADTRRAFRVLETAGAPVYYVPRDDVRIDLLSRAVRATNCEWKGDATYWTVTVEGRRAEDAAWSYERPLPGFEAITGHLAFYAGGVDEAWVGDERATPQPGGFYGGWLTSRIVGPVKGEPGSGAW